MTNNSGTLGIWIGKFTVSGCHERVTLTNVPSSTDLPLLCPPGMGPVGMQFNNFAGFGLTLRTGSANPNDTNINQVANQLQSIQVLGTTPGGFSTLLLYPHQYPQFSSQDVFFQQDGQRTFFVTPRLTRQIWHWYNPATSVLANLSVPVNYYASSDIPAVNLPRVQTQVSARGPFGVVREAAIQKGLQASDVLASGILSWDTAWYPPAPIALWTTEYLYQPFFHPFVCDFIRAVKEYGIDGLLKWPSPASPTPLQLSS